MIRDILLPALCEKFPDRRMRAGSPPEAIAIFPAAHASVGDVSIWDDGDEATVSIGNITHHHFNPYDSNLSSQQLAEWVTESVTDFLDRLFADRVLLHQGRKSNWGSMQVLEDGEDFPETPDDADAFLWSGPVIST